MERRQIFIFGAIFAGVVGVLTIVYFAFLRPGYATLYEDVREADAAQIVDELEKQGIPYRLAEDGHRVLVPEDEIGQARIAVAGSGIAMGGVVGFELFNEADMGLTEFAEKVNYQRALQGELARTIMMMEGVGFARVHLSLPERSLFRADRTSPKAAVTIQTPAGQPLDQAQVEGIQRLIASTVTGLSVHDVAILNDKGDLISTSVTENDPDTAMDEQGALEAYFRARARRAAEELLPGIPFELRVSAQGWAPDTTAINPGSDGDTDASQARERNLNLRLALRTESDLNEENRALLRSAIGAAIALDPARGDVLRFETGPLGIAGNAQWASHTSAAVPGSPMPSTVHHKTAGRYPVTSGWLLLLLIVAGGGGALLLRRRSRMGSAEQTAFAELLSAQLEGSRHG
ncbi:flagellar M-ring protein FliF [Croceicoccus estronivorus]|uniref:flagellar basal-body MS-ring/collar protein FliF n=1 Tax=Croceicoccus estronivorus TaxID=1172626 RepID=UPI00082C6B21|nr:flagellar basal-body MS-ring/collar protein FliF [Croceicoccus estronivorus]OCC22938.1 flagellar M-ring protein FliF [Croceicoccus estronivorus]